VGDPWVHLLPKRRPPLTEPLSTGRSKDVLPIELMRKASQPQKTVLKFAAFASILAFVVVGGWLLIPPLYFDYKINSLNTAKERQLLYQLNHEVLGSELREFANQYRWSNPRHDAQFNYYRRTDSEVPEPLRALNPSAIRIFDDRIELEFGGAFLNFGIAAFRPGLVGGGNKKLGEGIWFYSEDGHIPKR
jgi:hypothetical protein